MEKTAHFVYGVWLLGGYCIQKKVLLLLLPVYAGQLPCVSTAWVAVLNVDVIFSFDFHFCCLAVDLAFSEL